MFVPFVNSEPLLNQLLKIALISHLFPTELFPFHGKFIKDQLSLLNSDENIEADLVVPTPYSIPFTQRYRKLTSELLADEFQATRIKYLSLPAKRIPRIIQSSLSKAIKQHFQFKKYDLVHIHWLYPDGLAIPQIKKMGFKCVLTIHGSDWYKCRENGGLMEILLKVLTEADRVLYSGPKLKEDIEEVYPWLEQKSDVIYNHVNTESYSLPTLEEVNKAKSYLGWNTKKINALTVANIRHEKGIDLLIDAIQADDEFQEIDFHIVGSIENDDYGQMIKNRIEQDLITNIKIHSPVSPDKLIKFYHAGDFFVLPSRREGFNVSILEALSTGLPVICTPVGGNNEVVDDRAGLTTDKISSYQIQMALKKMKSSYKKYDRQEIRTITKGKYGVNGFLKRLINNYAQVI